MQDRINGGCALIVVGVFYLALGVVVGVVACKVLT